MSVAAFAAAPDFAEPLEAWRVWRVVERDDGLALASIVKHTIWPAGEPLHAECLRCRQIPKWLWRRPSHEAPTAPCECGIYAASLEHALVYLRDGFPDALLRVIGRVALWGTVVECERGYRASHAYPLSLHVPVDTTPSPPCSPAEIAEELARYTADVRLVRRRRPGRGATALSPGALGGRG